MICEYSYVKNKWGKSLRVLVLDWKQSVYPDKHLQEFENKKEQGAQISETEGKGEINSC